MGGGGGGVLKEEPKCSDSSVVRCLISGLLRLVSKLSDITCTCLVLDLAITARAGHFTDSLSKNLAAVEKKIELIEQNHIVMFSTRFYHIFTCIYTVFAHDKDHILKLRTLAHFLKRNF